MANWSNTYFEVSGKKEQVEKFAKRFKKGLEGEYWYDNSVKGMESFMDCVYIDEWDSFMSVSGSGKWNGPYELVMKWAKEIGKGLKVHYIDYEPGSDFYVEFEVENGIVTMERSTTYYTKDFFKWVNEADIDIMGEMEFVGDDYTVLLHIPIIVWNMKELNMWNDFVEKYLDKNDPEFIEVMKAFSILEENKEKLLKLCVTNENNFKKTKNIVSELLKDKLDYSELSITEDEIIRKGTYFVRFLCDYEKGKK
jgi:hypothetical protein